MKYLIASLLYSVLMLSSCSKIKEELLLDYPSEEEKLINETFLQVIGTELYYKFSDEHLDAVHRMEERGASEKEKLEYYEKHKEEDLKKLVVFTRDKFLGVFFSDNQSKNLHPELLFYIRYGLERGNFIKFGDSSATHILETLSQPLEISSLGLFQTGRYKLVREKDKNKVQGEYKTYGSFNSSKVFIDSKRNRAVFFYERDCMEGNKCSSGTLVFFQKEDNHWHVSKQITIYQT